MEHKITQKKLAMISICMSNTANILLSVGETHAEKDILINGKETKITFDIKNSDVKYKEWNKMSDIKKIDTFALIDELSNRTKWELEFGLLTLLKNRKIDYKSISEMYVKALEEWNKDEKNIIINKQKL